MRRYAMRAVAVAIGAVALLVCSGGAASAHPLGNFTVNRYSGIVVAVDGVTVEHVLDLAEIPTAQRSPAIDVDGDGQLAPDELGPWAATQCAATERTLRLTVRDTRVPLTVTRSSATTAPGQASCGSRGATPAARGGSRPAPPARAVRRTTAGTTWPPAPARSSPTSCTGIRRCRARSCRS